MQNNDAVLSTPWEERFGWYHYDGRAIYEFTEKDLDAAAELYSANGVTAVILFGAHFRFSKWRRRGAPRR